MQRALEGLDGVKKVEVSFKEKLAVVVYDSKRVQPSEMVRAVQGAAYE